MNLPFYYKVSDLTPTYEEVKDGLIQFVNQETGDVLESLIIGADTALLPVKSETDGSFWVGQDVGTLIVIHSTDIEHDFVPWDHGVFPSPGIYVADLSIGTGAQTKVTFTYGTETIHTMAPEFLPAGVGVPAVTTSDNGKFMRVVNGAWAAVALESAEGGNF